MLSKAFFDSVKIGNIGIIDSIQKTIAIGNSSAVASLAASITEETLMDYNAKQVFGIYAENMGNDSADYRSNETLQEIAHQHAGIGGSAVFTARAMLEIFIPEPELDLNQYRLDRWKKQTKDEPLVRLYPNPTMHTLFVLYDGKSEQPLQLQVMDGLGRLMQKQTSERKLNRVNVSDFPAGLYYISVNDGVKTQMFKFVVVK